MVIMASTYQRTGTNDGSQQGLKYENKMTAFTALRLYSNSDEFYLANNLTSGEKLDDLVFTYKVKNRWSTYFVQLKHKQARKITLANLRSKGSDFVISKYFDSYKKIYRKFNPQSNDVIFQKMAIGARFVVFTNGFLNEEITNRNPKKINCDILSTNMPDEYNISFDVEKDKDILTNMLQDPQLREFVKKFYFCTCQANESEVDEAIEREVKKIMLETTNESQHWTESDLKAISLKFCADLYSWYTKGKYLTKEDIRNILFDISVASQCGKKNAVTWRFTPDFCQFNLNFLKKDKIVCLESKADNSIMCMALLKQMGLTDEPNKLMEIKQLETNQFKQHLLGLKNVADVTVVIDCDTDTLGMKKEELVTFFRQLFAAKPELAVIFVTSVGNAAALALIVDLQIKRRKFNCTLMHLSAESKLNIMSCDAIFQGYPTKLALLLSSINKKAFDDVINMALMSQMLQGKRVKIGECPIEQIPYYVPRVLTRHATIAPYVFNDRRVDACFALSGISLEDAVCKLPNAAASIAHASDPTSHQKKFIILESHEEALFEEVAKKCAKPIHWLVKTLKSGNLWKWKKSTENIKELASHVDRSNRQIEFVPTDNIMVVKEKVVVIIAEPGMGKSTLVTHLAVETKRRNPEMWIISLALNDYTSKFDDPTFLNDVKLSTRNLIAFAAGVTDKDASKLNLRLFNQCYDVSGNMIILLDGFDEITPYYTEHGLAIIKALQETAVSRIWVTARPVLHHLLEDATSCFSYSIKPFEEKDQINFLNKFWKNEIRSVDPEKLTTYIKTVLQSVANSFDKKLDQFTGIPLQTRMLAEVFQSGLQTYHDTGELVLKDRINGVKLFEEFVRIKRGIQMEKAKITVSNAAAHFELKMLNEAREKDLMHLALLTLLPRQTCAGLYPPIDDVSVQNLKEVVQQGNEKSGIVVSFTGETPQFIHRTFAEYFVALFFTRNFKSNKAFMLSEKFQSENFEFVKYFFDRILSSDCKLHHAILERNNNQVEKIVRDKKIVNEKDWGGRTALHVAAAIPGSESAIRMLLKAGADVDAADNIFQVQPVICAVLYGDAANIAALYENSKIASLPQNAIPITWESLRIALRGDYLKLLLHLVKNGIYGKENLNKLKPNIWLDFEENVIQQNMSILHVAAAYNAVKILQHLIANFVNSNEKSVLLHQKDGNSRTPLMVAAQYGAHEAVDCFVAAGEVLPTNSANFLLELAVAKKDLQLVKNVIKTVYSVQDKTEKDKLTEAVVKLISDTSEFAAIALDLLLTECPSLVHAKTESGFPLVIVAIKKLNVTAIKKFCDAGTDVRTGFPIHVAIYKKNLLVFKELLKCPRIDVNSLNNAGITPLYLAAKIGLPDFFQLLADTGADLDRVTRDGSDVTHAVGQSCDEAIFFYLLEHGFNFRKMNDAGETGLSLLQKNDAFSLVVLLGETNYQKKKPLVDEQLKRASIKRLRRPQGRRNVALQSLSPVKSPAKGAGPVCKKPGILNPARSYEVGIWGLPSKSPPPPLMKEILPKPVRPDRRSPNRSNRVSSAHELKCVPEPVNNWKNADFSSNSTSKQPTNPSSATSLSQQNRVQSENNLNTIKKEPVGGASYQPMNARPATASPANNNLNTIKKEPVGGASYQPMNARPATALPANNNLNIFPKKTYESETAQSMNIRPNNGRVQSPQGSLNNVNKQPTAQTIRPSQPPQSSLSNVNKQPITQAAQTVRPIMRIPVVAPNLNSEQQKIVNNVQPTPSSSAAYTIYTRQPDTGYNQPRITYQSSYSRPSVTIPTNQSSSTNWKIPEKPKEKKTTCIIS